MVMTEILQRFVFNVGPCFCEDPISHLQGHLTSSVMVRPRWMRGGASGTGLVGVGGDVDIEQREKKGQLLTLGTWLKGW